MKVSAQVRNLKKKLSGTSEGENVKTTEQLLQMAAVLQNIFLCSCWKNAVMLSFMSQYVSY